MQIKNQNINVRIDLIFLNLWVVLEIRTNLEKIKYKRMCQLLCDTFTPGPKITSQNAIIIKHILT